MDLYIPPCLQTLPPDFSIYDLVQHMRTQRPSVVQTKVAFTFFCLLLPLIRRNNGLDKNSLLYSTSFYGVIFKGNLLHFFPPLCLYCKYLCYVW